MLLGHCICDPRRNCPCDVFSGQGICPCAGERPEPADPATVRLTQLVRNPGCASKISPSDLEHLLTGLPEVRDPAVISGLAAADDAAIYRIAENLCLVQTVDVFTPCVDDPHLFGRICAANCLSDIYAMGGEPRTALSILAFPSETLDGQIMRLMLTGAMELLAEAGVALIGGHSIKDDEIKLGFAVTGIIDPETAASLERAHPGDVLVLTKPLGTGVLAFAHQIGLGEFMDFDAGAKSMATLNRAAAEAMKEAGASACTDITGFGLFGHLLKLARQSKMTIRIFGAALPSFPGVMKALKRGIVPGAIERNREFVGDAIEVERGVTEAVLDLGYDAQTSGGLLITVAPERLGALQEELRRRLTPGYVIGRVVGESNGRILLSAGDGTGSAASSSGVPTPVAESFSSSYCLQTGMEQHSTKDHARDQNCCADAFDPKISPGTALEAQRGFGAMLRAVQSGGVLEAKTKELILLSLVIQSRCAACFDAHFHQARQLGISDAEIEEAAWCAIAMGGAPVRMFFQECLARLGHTATGSIRKP